MTASIVDRGALARLLREQDGLVTTSQAYEVGMTSSSLSRRIRPGGGWQRVLPHVYMHGQQEPTQRQRARAAVMYAGFGAALTGAAALHWHRLRHLPDELRPDQVDVVAAPGRQTSSHGWARVHRSSRPCDPYLVDGLRVVPVTRAVVDAASMLPDDAVLALACVAVHAGRTSPEQLEEELATASRRGSRALTRALVALSEGARSVPEARALRLFASAGLPTPLVNQALSVGGRILVPDLRWGRVIVEIDSKAHHLLVDGTWESTQQRRAFLTAHGYHVIPVTPEMLRDTPEEVVAAVRSALGLSIAG